MRLDEWKGVFTRSVKRFKEDDCLGLAQQIAYSSLLAVFPALAGLIGFLKVSGLFDDVLNVLSGTVPDGVTSFVRSIDADSHGGAGPAALVVGLGLAIWAASGGMSALIKAVNRAYSLEETRPFWKQRALAILLVVLTGLVAAIVFILIVLGGDLGRVISRQPGVGDAFDPLWGSLRWPIAFLAILVFFSLVYTIAPNRTGHWRWTSAGAIVGSLLWLVLSALFQLYVTYAGHYSRTYGALATGVILLLWINYSSYALLFGAELNSELERRRG
ncbi:MAG TPA: YihY/virulence factor BrkB family protein [Gaiellaceae bacterium]|jgi:membrane protein|nr:YihY/virulence factor BrkB family protein [Gaiellaceae bacterium]